ncbi:hypothetical protein F7725_026480 [Dissostichus mawsoni]|uniref:RING-type E3 ubiquitin transferase n=1 Tax=Dissostichus mawsoni TaxID=36200 RepID=A0A7J5X772_DISMA|nr:hypothetical protein F7725_026480 [Dissostichus mawsoni]
MDEPWEKRGLAEEKQDMSQDIPLQSVMDSRSRRLPFCLPSSRSSYTSSPTVSSSSLSSSRLYSRDSALNNDRLPRASSSYKTDLDHQSSRLPSSSRDYSSSDSRSSSWKLPSSLTSSSRSYERPWAESSLSSRSKLTDPEPRLGMRSSLLNVTDDGDSKRAKLSYSNRGLYTRTPSTSVTGSTYSSTGLSSGRGTLEKDTYDSSWSSCRLLSRSSSSNPLSRRELETKNDPVLSTTSQLPPLPIFPSVARKHQNPFPLLEQLIHLRSSQEPTRNPVPSSNTTSTSSSSSYSSRFTTHLPRPETPLPARPAPLPARPAPLPARPAPEGVESDSRSSTRRLLSRLFSRRSSQDSSSGSSSVRSLDDDSPSTGGESVDKGYSRPQHLLRRWDNLEHKVTQEDDDEDEEDEDDEEEEDEGAVGLEAFNAGRPCRLEGETLPELEDTAVDVPLHRRAYDNISSHMSQREKPTADQEKLRKIKERLLLEESDDEEGDLCRICQMGEEAATNPLIQPCRCIGSLQFVHQDCIKRWLRSKIGSGTNLEAIATCELCKEKLRLNIDNFDIQELYRTHVQNMMSSSAAASTWWCCCCEQRFSDVLGAVDAAGLFSLVRILHEHMDNLEIPGESDEELRDNRPSIEFSDLDDDLEEEY